MTKKHANYPAYKELKAVYHVEKLKVAGENRVDIKLKIGFQVQYIFADFEESDILFTPTIWIPEHLTILVRK